MKYFLCVLLIAFASQASAQLRCFTCTNCNSHLQQPILNCVHPVLPTPPAGTTIAPPPPPPPTPGPATTPGTEPPGTLTPVPTNPPAATLPPPPGNPTVPGGPPELTPETLAPADAETTTAMNDSPNVRQRRNVEPIDPLAHQFSCFVVRVPGATAGTTQVNRGCVANGGNTDQTCRRAISYSGAPQECRICSGNECNTSSGFMLKTSMILIFGSILIAFRLK